MISIWVTVTLLIAILCLTTSCINYSMGSPSSNSAILQLDYGAYKNPRMTAIDKIDGHTVVSLSLKKEDDFAYLTPGPHLLSTSCYRLDMHKRHRVQKNILLHVKAAHHYEPRPLNQGDCETIIKDLGIIHSQKSKR